MASPARNDDLPDKGTRRNRDPHKDAPMKRVHLLLLQSGRLAAGPSCSTSTISSLGSTTASASTCNSDCTVTGVSSKPARLAILRALKHINVRSVSRQGTYCLSMSDSLAARGGVNTRDERFPGGSLCFSEKTRASSASSLACKGARSPWPSSSSLLSDPVVLCQRRCPCDLEAPAAARQSSPV